MLSSKSSVKPTEKASSDSASLSFDLYSILTYMAALAAGEPSRDIIFKHATQQNFKTAVFFKKIYLLTKRLGFEYVHAFRLVARQTNVETVKSLLLRFGSAMSSGESEVDFLLQESQIEQEKYEGEYMRKVESLQKWSDAYAAFLVSSTLIMVVALVSTMIFEIGNMFMVLMGGMMVPLIGFGVFVIYTAAPYELVTYESRGGPTWRRRSRLMLKILGPLGVTFGVLMSYMYGPGAGFIVFGLSLIPAGIFAYLDDSKIYKADQEVAPFFRALGNVAASLGSTLTSALSSLDRRSMEVLEPYIHRLQMRLDKRLSPEVCWEEFRDEVGSELMNRASRMFVDGASLGGSPDKVGSIASDYALSIAQLRAKRKSTATTFAMLVIPLHAAMTALLVFILEITKSFNEQLRGALDGMMAQQGGLPVHLPNLPIFNPRDLGMAVMLVTFVIVVLTIGNSLVPKIATGGNKNKILIYLPVMSIISGVSLLLIPPIAQRIMTI